MSTQQWAGLASSLGIKPSDTPRSGPEAQKFARKIGKRRNIPEKQLTELLLPVLTSISNDYPRLLSVLSTTFNREAVPLDHPSFIFNKTRLPTPRPAITIGYNPQIFHPHYRELMQGIISDSSNQPRNLDKISQACPNMYWPFFAIEISDTSMSPTISAASAAATTATCNNALLTLASVLNDISNPIVHDTSFRTLLITSIASFSLSITTQIKSATLYAHTTSFSLDGIATDAIEPIRTYNLNNPSDLDHLTARLSSLFEWAEKTRLLAIMDLLDKFDARVQFRETKLAQEMDAWGPMDVMQRGQLAPKLMPGMVTTPPSPPTTTTNRGKHTTKGSVSVDRGSAGRGGGLGSIVRATSKDKNKPNSTLPIPAAVLAPRSTSANAIAPTERRSDSRDSATHNHTSNGTYQKAGWLGPETPRTPESMKLNLSLNTAAPVVVGAGGVAKVKKPSLFKTVINDAVPAWARVEI